MRLDQKIGGTLILVGTVQFLFLVQIAEFLYPGYSTSQSAISDLGATCQSSACSIVQPTSMIFDSSVFVLGLLLLLGSYCLYSDGKSKLFCIFLALAGIGSMGVGVFPETMGSLHTLVSFITFFFGGLAAVYSFRFLPSVLRHISVIMGAITLGALVLYASNVYLGLGLGGMERMIAYPALFWGLVFASYLLSSQKQPTVLT